MLESKAAFARRMGWNRSTATRYAKDGKLVLDDHGQVDVEASQARLSASKDPLKEGVRQRHQAQRQGRGRGSESDSTRVDPNDSAYQLLTKHRAARESEEALMARMEREKIEGKLVDTDAVRKRALQTSRAARDAVMNLQHRIDPLLAGEADQVKRAEIWDRELRLICEEISRGSVAPLEAAGSES
jgi:hypothetical protein